MSLKENTSPVQYVYGENVQVEIPGRFLYDLMKIFHNLVVQGTKSEHPFKYSYVNKETGEIVKNAKQKDIDAGKVELSADHEKMMASKPIHSLTSEALEFLKVRNYIGMLHYNNIEEGKAVLMEDIVNDEIDKLKESK